MENLEQARKEIDRIDAEMRRLFLSRMAVAKEIAAYKKEHGIPVLDAAREEEVVRRNCERLEDAALEPYYAEFLRNMMAVSRSYQNERMREVRVAVSGESAGGVLAAGRLFPAAQCVEYPSVRAAYRAVETGEADSAVLPLENSVTGEVGRVSDLIFSGSLYLNEVLWAKEDGAEPVPAGNRISPATGCETASPGGGTRAEIAPGTDRAETGTAKTETDVTGHASAAPESSAVTPESTSVTGDRTAEIGGQTAEETDSVTRYGAFSRKKNVPEGAEKREDEDFLLAFTVRNESGALAGALNIIGAHGYNLRSLRSRPMQGLRWGCYFLLEAEGNINTGEGAQMMRELSAVCARLRLVGSYRADNVR